MGKKIAQLFESSLNMALKWPKMTEIYDFKMAQNWPKMGNAYRQAFVVTGLQIVS